MFKYSLDYKASYSEMPQVNPLKWKILFRDGDTFKAQSAWLVCKDFFNDVVAFLNTGTEFVKYGFRNNVQHNDEGIYLLLKNVNDNFVENIETLNKQLRKDLGVQIDVVDNPNKMCVLLLPLDLWKSTYIISLTTMCLRLCNYGYVINEWLDFWGEAAKIDKAFNEHSISYVKKNGFGVPDTYKKYWSYAGDRYNSSIENFAKNYPSIIHAPLS